MLDRIPSGDEMKSLLGESLYNFWTQLTACIDEKYDMERTWNKGGKAWKYEYKYRRAVRRCALCMRGKTAWDSWSSLEKRREQSSKRTKMSMPKRFIGFMKNPRPITMENG